MSFFVLACLVWLGPIVWVGLTHRSVPNVGNYLNNQYRIACLFTRKTPSWTTYYAEVKLEGQPDWIGLDLDDYSDMKPFGYTNRLHRLISKARNNRNKESILSSLAYWIKGKYESGLEGDQKVEAMRFSGVRLLVGDPVMANPKGRWVVVPIEETSGKDRKVFGTIQFNGNAR